MADTLRSLTPEEELRRAGQADQILNDPLVKAALDDIEANVLAWWEASEVKAQDFREKCWAIYCASRKFRGMLQTHIETGKLARAQIEHDNKFKEMRDKAVSRVAGLFRS